MVGNNSIKNRNHVLVMMGCLAATNAEESFNEGKFWRNYHKLFIMSPINL